MDFLELVEDIKAHIGDTKTIGKYYINNYKEFFIKNYENDENTINRILSNTKNNFWIEHFKNRKNIIGERWIDFETEISNVLKKLVFSDKMDSIFYNLFEMVVDIFKNVTNSEIMDEYPIEKFSLLENIITISPDENDNIREIINKNINKDTCSISKEEYNTILKYIIMALEDDLIRLIRVFEMYICLVINRQDINKISEDIISIPLPVKVVSFNYTRTYLKIFEYVSEDIQKFNQYNSTIRADIYSSTIPKEKDVLYIHGSANEENMNSQLKIEENNDDMILGVYEELKDEKNLCDNFIFFKKYYQRILKNTDRNNESEEEFNNRVPEENRKFTYKRCLDNIKNCCVYIYGHSLDVSDNDILEKLITDSNKTIIYYHNRETNKIQIINLIKMLGQKKLVEYRNSGKIIFRKQKEDFIHLGG